MFYPKFDYQKLGAVVETLLTATAGALLFVWAGFPAGLISGSVLAVATAALLGRQVAISAPLARASFVLIGISLGVTVTPETLHGIVDWPISIAIAMLSAACMTLGTTFYLRLVHGWDPLSALYGGSPGALTQVMVLASDQGADVRAIVIVQTVRVVFLTVGIPAGLAFFGFAVASNATMGTQGLSGSLDDVAILVGFSTLMALLLHWFRFPASMIFGAMLGSGILHGGGYTHAALPSWLASAAIVTLGATTGARFANTPIRLLFSYTGAALGSFAVAITITTAFVFIVNIVVPGRIADLVIAFSPGAQDTMMVLALALHIDPVFVSAHQLARYLVVSLSLPFLAHLSAPAGDKRDKEP
jgi:membrane AbrB-like protein